MRLEEDGNVDPLKVEFSVSMDMYDSDFLKNMCEVQDLEMDDIQLSAEELSDVAYCLTMRYEWDLVLISLIEDKELREYQQECLTILYNLKDDLCDNYQVRYTHAHKTNNSANTWIQHLVPTPKKMYIFWGLGNKKALHRANSVPTQYAPIQKMYINIHNHYP